MKYICFLNEQNVEEIITFPNTINHDVMAQTVGYMKTAITGRWKREHRKPISAGFVTSKGFCFAESLTLKLKSREKDTAILEKQFAL